MGFLLSGPVYHTVSAASARTYLNSNSQLAAAMIKCFGPITVLAHDESSEVIGHGDPP
jgi:hypothetical protein